MYLSLKTYNTDKKKLIEARLTKTFDSARLCWKFCIMCMLEIVKLRHNFRLLTFEFLIMSAMNFHFYVRQGWQIQKHNGQPSSQRVCHFVPSIFCVRFGFIHCQD